MKAQTEVFRQLVRDHMAPPPPVLGPEASCGDAVARIAAAGATSALVAAADGRVLGIVTEQDVVRRIAFAVDRGAPVAEAMTRPVRTVRADDYLFHAIAQMRRHRLRHLPVVDDMGQAVGILHLHVAIEVAADQLMTHIDRLAHDGTDEGLARIKVAQVDVAATLFADDVPAPEIQNLLTHINRDIHRRVIEGAIAAMDGAGWGPPPVRFAAIVMGSGGRGENYVYPDQDNGFILDDYADRDHDRIDPWFIELAERMTASLDRIGFPLCKGYVMATNPLWRKTASQWREQTLLWARKRSVVALRLSDIFYDFVSVYGEGRLAEALREQVTELTRANPAYLQEMYRDSEDYGVALGWFGRFITEKDVDEHRGEINLKHSGTLPLVGAVRLLSLKHGIAATSTLERLERLHATGYLDRDEFDYLTGAFRHITGLLLRQQVADFKAGGKVSNYVAPDSLSKREKDMLTDSFKAIAALRDRMRHEFTGEVF